MNRNLMAAVVLVCGAALGAAAVAADRATPKEAEAMVKKGVAYMKATPREKALADISDRKGPFVDRDLYLTVYSLDGVCLAHGANDKMIGKNNIAMKDIDGKEFFRERFEMAKVKQSFWQDYKFADPLTKKIEPKSMYCERAGELVVCGGVYKPA
jgi:signal transduction histidine kinase